MKHYDKELKFRINDEMLGILDEQVACDASTASKSDWLRKVIISSADFDKNLGLQNLNWLEKHVKNSVEFFNKPGIYFEAEKISEAFPAFLLENSESAMIAIKHPIYKVRILNQNLLSDEMIKNLLKTERTLVENQDLYFCYEPVIMINDYLRASWPTNVLSIWCLSFELEKSEKIKNAVKLALDAHGCKTEVWPEHLLQYIPVEIHTINETKFIKTL